MAKQPSRFLVEPDGTIRFIYDDKLAEVARGLNGTIHPCRASHVEPTDDGQWEADLSPVGGPVLGPFALRQDALDAEVDWLRTHNHG